ncbi:MAG: nucleotidyltransferase domain-containing protein [Bacillota bacterium]|nr:nucleotidyltransferase domain-containing protein [Bacillota bacterium]
MRYGLSDNILQALINELNKHDCIQNAILFGSRARGDYRHNSDIDLAIDCEGQLPVGLYSDLDDAAGIYKIDVIDLRHLSNETLLFNINRDGIIIYQQA